MIASALTCHRFAVSLALWQPPAPVPWPAMTMGNGDPEKTCRTQFKEHEQVGKWFEAKHSSAMKIRRVADRIRFDSHNCVIERCDEAHC